MNGASRQATTMASHRSASAGVRRLMRPGGDKRVSCTARHLFGAGAEEHAVHAVPMKVAQQAPQAPFSAREIDVMAEARLDPDAVLARLLRIDLPRMKIKYAGLGIGMIYSPHRPTRQRIRQQAEVA